MLIRKFIYQSVFEGSKYDIKGVRGYLGGTACCFLLKYIGNSIYSHARIKHLNGFTWHHLWTVPNEIIRHGDTSTCRRCGDLKQRNISYVIALNSESSVFMRSLPYTGEISIHNILSFITGTRARGIGGKVCQLQCPPTQNNIILSPVVPKYLTIFAQNISRILLFPPQSITQSSFPYAKRTLQFSIFIKIRQLVYKLLMEHTDRNDRMTNECQYISRHPYI